MDGHTNAITAWSGLLDLIPKKQRNALLGLAKEEGMPLIEVARKRGHLDTITAWNTLFNVATE